MFSCTILFLKNKTKQKKTRPKTNKLTNKQPRYFWILQLCNFLDFDSLADGKFSINFVGLVLG